MCAAPDSLEVCELFESIAGESTHAGRPAVFVRLAGCNLNCRWCDTERARQGGTRVALDRLLDSIGGLRRRLAVVTGGEPLLQPAAVTLCSRLLAAGKQVLVETNGSLDISVLPPGARVILDMKAPSSGQSELMDRDNIRRLRPGDELKIVVADGRDFDWAVRLIRTQGVPEGVNILLSPAFKQMDPAELAGRLLRSDLEVRMQLQLHRFIWPNGRDGIPVPLRSDGGDRETADP